MKYWNTITHEHNMLCILYWCLFIYTGVYASTDTCWCGKEGCTRIQGLASGLYSPYVCIKVCIRGFVREQIWLKIWIQHVEKPPCAIFWSNRVNQFWQNFAIFAWWHLLVIFNPSIIRLYVKKIEFYFCFEKLLCSIISRILN